MAAPRDVEFLIDGYNLMMFLGGARVRPGPNALERARAAFLEWLADSLPDPSAATVVFDAREESKSRAKAKSPRQELIRGVKAIFALGYADADTLIAELAAAHPRPRSLRVVSNDRAVRDAARRARAGSIACQAFQELLASPPRRKPDPPSEDSAGSGEKPSATTAEETAALVKAFESAPVKKSEPQKRSDKKAEKAIAKVEKRPAAFDDPALADFYREMLAYSPEKSDGDSGPKRRK